MNPLKKELQRYERALKKFFGIPAAERKQKDREKLLTILGVPNPQEFLNMHIPLWQARIDELLDPTSTDMLPISIGHSYVNWVRGAIRQLPRESRVKIFSSKMKLTGLKKAIQELIGKIRGRKPKDFYVDDVQLVDKIHKDTRVSVVTDEGERFDLYISRFGCTGEYIFSGLPGIVEIPAQPVQFHVTPQGEEILIKPVEEGVNLYLDDSLPADYFLENWEWIVEGVARCDALGDAIGTALRFGHYMATEDRRVYTIDNIEIFHLDSTDVKIHEPVYDFISRRVHPDDAKKRKQLREKLRKKYEEVYEAQMAKIREKWPQIERYLSEFKRLIREYTGEPFEIVLSRIRSRIFGKK
ncbi:MAG: hypothetical protein D6713_04130 [Deltaproteobacteria bacterium]|nr:MAG: hypothetical protein D6713_04130 [Deltaproteobacteria bacterium]